MILEGRGRKLVAGLEERAMVILLGCRWGRVIDLSILSFVCRVCNGKPGCLFVNGCCTVC